MPNHGDIPRVHLRAKRQHIQRAAGSVCPENKLTGVGVGMLPRIMPAQPAAPVAVVRRNVCVAHDRQCKTVVEDFLRRTVDVRNERTEIQQQKQRMRLTVRRIEKPQRESEFSCWGIKADFERLLHGVSGAGGHWRRHYLRGCGGRRQKRAVLLPREDVQQFPPARLPLRG